MNNLPMENMNISNWKKPGGKLGMVVAGLLGAGALLILYKILPFLITLATNIITLAVLCAIIALILFLVTDKKVRMLVSAIYFMVMRAITSAIVEIDPIAIVERRLMDMRKKIGEISKTMGDLKGLIRDNENKIQEKKATMENELRKIQVLIEKGNKPAAQVSQNQVNRLEGVIKNQIKRLQDSKKWYEVLSKLEEMANLTVIDTENAVQIRKEEFESIKKQHKAFRSVMSVMKGDPDEMALFNQAMDHMANDINAKLGEMEHVLDSTGGLLSQYDAESGVSSKKADEILEKYNKYGLEGLFESFSPKPIETSNESIINIDFKPINNQISKSKYF